MRYRAPVRRSIMVSASRPWLAFSLLGQIEQQLFEYFMSSYGPAFDLDAQIVLPFFRTLLKELGQERLEVDIPRSALPCA